MRKLFLIAAVAFFWALSVAAQSGEKGQSICYEVQNVVNALVDYTQTSCLPSRGKAGALSFIVLSSQPVFSVEASKKAWLLVVVGAIGKSLNERPSVKADELWLSDANLIPGGHLKLPHAWPGQNPPSDSGGTVTVYAL